MLVQLSTPTCFGQTRQARIGLPGEGAEVIASNLAHHYALTGQRVLLVDGDLRRAPLTRQLAPQRTNGLLDVLVRGQSIESAILHDAATGLHFLPAMSPAPLETARPELLASRQMAVAVHAMTGQFDIIILDAPPLLPVVDGRILADYADQIVFVMTWRRTPRQLARRALQTLGFNHDKVAGVVVNAVAVQALEDTYALGTRMGPARARPGRVRDCSNFNQSLDSSRHHRVPSRRSARARPDASPELP